MPYDPTLPLPNSPLESQVIRDQLQALFNLINSIVTLTAAQVDGVSTLNPGDPASASITVIGNTLHFTFSLPRGDEGLPGPQGIQGPSFANAVIDAVTTLQPNDAATVLVSFDGANVHFNFGIPRGQTGESGTNGNDGGVGPQGLPGEVTTAQLNSAISGTSANTNSVSTLDSAFADPDMEALRAKMNELILNGRR